ncbi:MAG: hypothetical protein LBR91_03680 [Puniceicoccales bacterium]|jgi:hypothetical protein|nr:hypothetical protein [Puniceicoccales bacterium]
MEGVDNGCTYKYVHEEFTCKKSIRNSTGRIDPCLCYQRGEYSYEIKIIESSDDSFVTKITEVPKEVFRSTLRSREGRKASNQILKKLNNNVDKYARRRDEPCEYSYSFEYETYSPNGFVPGHDIWYA